MKIVADSTVPVAGGPSELLERYSRLRQAEPKLRARDAAARLGVSECELVAARCRQGVTRLDGRWGPLLKSLPELGTVMTLTRNDYAVHEKVGRFEDVSVSESGGLVLGADIDLRINFSRWRFGYAVTEESSGAVRNSLQFFDGAGTAVQKIYLRDDSDRDAHARLVAAHTAGSQIPGEPTIAPRRSPASRRPDEEVDAEALRRRWSTLQDVHHFAGLLRDFGVSRVQACRLVGPEFAERVTPESYCLGLEQAAAQGMPIMVFVPSPGVVQIHTGPVQKLKRVGEWFNVLDPGFNLHLRDDGIVSNWLVRKPTREGVVTSLEIFDAGDSQIAWMFGERERGQSERPEWRRLAEGMERVSGTV
jgi:putative hemin transport protein